VIRERERERVAAVAGCGVCVTEDREREEGWDSPVDLCVCVCVCVYRRNGGLSSRHWSDDGGLARRPPRVRSFLLCTQGFSVSLKAQIGSVYRRAVLG